MTKWIVKYKDYGSRVRTTSHSGNLTREEVIDFFGLEDDDIIEWYQVLREEEDNEE